MDYDGITVRKHAGVDYVAEIVLDRADALNALNTAMPEVTVGLVPGGGGTQLALRRLGTGLAADLILTGRRVTIDEACTIGLVARRVPAGEARATAIEVATTIAKNSPVAVKAAKRALRNGWGVPLDRALDIEDAAWRTAALSADRREGIAAFAEKRVPRWPGE